MLGCNACVIYVYAGSSVKQSEILFFLLAVFQMKRKKRRDLVPGCSSYLLLLLLHRFDSIG